MWGSNFINILNERFRELVIPLIVLGLTNSPFATGLVALSQQFGAILFAIPIGTWVEKKNKVKVIALCHLLYGIGLFVLAYFIMSSGIHAYTIAFVLFFMGIVALISRTTFSAMIPNITGRSQLLRAHTSLEAADAISTLIGPAIGGFILGGIGASPTLVVCAILSIGSMCLIVMMTHLPHENSMMEKRIKSTAMEGKLTDFMKQSLVGTRLLFANSSQMISTLAICVLSFSTVFIILTVLFHAKLTYNFSEGTIGILLSSAGAGNIIGILIMNRFKRSNWLLLLSILILVSALGVFTIVVSGNFVIMCIGMAIFDGALSMAFVVQSTVHQGITPDWLLARVRGATYVISGAFTMLGIFLAGTIPELFSSKIALIVGVCFLAIPGVFILKFKRYGGALGEIEPV